MRLPYTPDGATQPENTGANKVKDDTLADEVQRVDGVESASASEFNLMLTLDAQALPSPQSSSSHFSGPVCDNDGRGVSTSGKA